MSNSSNDVVAYTFSTTLKVVTEISSETPVTNYH